MQEGGFVKVGRSVLGVFEDGWKGWMGWMGDLDVFEKAAREPEGKSRELCQEWG